MPLATHASVQALLGRSLTSDELTRVDKLIDFASSQVISATGQQFSVVTGDTVDLSCVGGEAYIPQAPVLAITSVHVDPAFTNLLLTTQQYQIIDRILSLVPPHRWILPSNQTYPIFRYGLQRFTGTVRLVYDHGYATIPSDVEQAVGSAVAATLQQQDVNPDGVRADRLDDATVQFHYRDGSSLAIACEISPPALQALVDRYGVGAWSPRSQV